MGENLCGGLSNGGSISRYIEITKRANNPTKWENELNRYFPNEHIHEKNLQHAWLLGKCKPKLY